MGIILGILLMLISMVTAFILGGFMAVSDDSFHSEIEDREQEEYLERWLEQHRQKEHGRGRH